MKPYPDCLKCGKSPLLHALIGSTLACAWEDRSVKIVGDFGPATALIVADVYWSLGMSKKTPKSIVDAVLALRKKGITSW